MIKGYKVRLYPTKEQEELLWKHIHACRFIWNYMLAYQNENYANGGKYISEFGMNKLITPLRKQDEYSWLNEVNVGSLQTTCRNLDEAFKLFFKKKSNYPKFKSRHKCKYSYPVRVDRFKILSNSKTFKYLSILYSIFYSFIELKNSSVENLCSV